MLLVSTGRRLWAGLRAPAATLAPASVTAAAQPTRRLVPWNLTKNLALRTTPSDCPRGGAVGICRLAPPAQPHRLSIPTLPHPPCSTDFLRATVPGRPASAAGLRRRYPTYNTYCTKPPCTVPCTPKISQNELPSADSKSRDSRVIFYMSYAQRTVARRRRLAHAPRRRLLRTICL